MATMIPTKSKSGLSEASNNKSTPVTPRIGKLGRGGSTKLDPDSPSPHQNPRNSIDRSPLDSKPTVERRSPKITTPPDKQPRALKGSELQSQLGVVQEDLKKAKDRLASVEKEKARVLDELKRAKKSADEANEKLKEAVLAQKKAEDSSEIEKFRADELEQSGIEAAQRREEEWQKEAESIRNQHAVDAAALLSTTQDLQRVKHELAMTCDAKNTALSHADDAMKIAEINAEKVEFLSGEVSRLKSLLDSQLESKSNEAQELVGKLDLEIISLKHELENAEAAKEKLVEMEALIEGLRVEVTVAKKAESDAGDLMDEWKKKADLLQSRLEEANQAEKSTQDSLASLTAELEGSNALLKDAESEIATLRGKIEALEIETARQTECREESDRLVDMARHDASEMEKTVEVLKSELQLVEAAKVEAEKIATSSLQSLAEENNKLVIELGITRDEGEKVKKEVESLTSALDGVSTEARETKERFLAERAEVENAHSQIEELELALKDTKENYEVMLDEAKYEIDYLKKTVEISKTDAEKSMAEWDAKELSFVNAVKNSEEEIAALRVEMDRVVESLEESEHEAQAAKEDGVQLLNKLRQAESEATLANEAIEEVKVQIVQLKERLLDKDNELQSITKAAKEDEAQLLNKLRHAETEAAKTKEALEEVKSESLHLKERLLDKENELQSITQENDDLRIREATALEKIKELSSLLAEATAKKTEENGNHSYGENEHDLLPNSVESLDDNGCESEAEKPKSELPPEKVEECLREETKVKNENVNGNTEEGKPGEVESNMWETCKTVDKELLSSEREHEAESVDDDLDSKTDRKSIDQINGLSSETIDNGATSPTKHQQQQKKKKALLQKFGSLLKKKSKP